MLNELICPICKHTFRPRNNSQKFCSKSCGDIHTSFIRKSARLKKKKENAANEKARAKAAAAAKITHKLRLQHQKEASELGVSYGQYKAWLGAGLIKKADNG